jgi:hypothetical protein
MQIISKFFEGSGYGMMLNLKKSHWRRGEIDQKSEKIDPKINVFITGRDRVARCQSVRLATTRRGNTDPTLGVWILPWGFRRRGRFGLGQQGKVSVFCSPKRGLE